MLNLTTFASEVSPPTEKMSNGPLKRFKFELDKLDHNKITIKALVHATPDVFIFATTIKKIIVKHGRRRRRRRRIVVLHARIKLIQ